MLLCLHEEAAVAIAHGYAKVTGSAMAAAVHSNVGLMHATMAIFNAWCDRMPVIVLGATGPVDAAKRRPWIDWIHTARDQGALVRNYTKWDDQPASPGAAREAILRANWIANTAPRGPVYVNLDAELQEAKLAEPLPPIDAARFMPPVATAPPRRPGRARRRTLLKARSSPLILAGRVLAQRRGAGTRASRSPKRLGAQVVTDLKIGAAFPTDHPLHVGAPAHCARRRRRVEAIRSADVILSLDWVDLAGTLKQPAAPSPRKVIQVSLDHQLHNGWSMDYQGLPPVDVLLACEPDAAVPALLAALGERKPRACRRGTHDLPNADRRQAHRRAHRAARCATRSASARYRSRTCRCRGTARAGRSAIRSITSAPTAAAASAAAPASRSAPRWR